MRLLIASLLLFSPSVFCADIFLFGEKPGLSEPIKNPEKLPLRLHLARGERELVMVALPKQGAGLPVPSAEELSGEFLGGQPQLRAYTIASHHLADSSWNSAKGKQEVPDIVIPAEIAGKSGFRIPQGNLPSRAMFLFEIHVPDSAFPGTYAAKLAFKYGGTRHTIPLELRIYKAKLPHDFHLRSSFGFAPWGAMQRHFGKWVDREVELNRAYLDLAREHRIDLHKTYLKIPKDSPDLLLEGGPVSFMAQWENSPPGITDLPVPEQEKVKPRSAFWKSLTSSVREHNLEGRSFVYFWDEPKDFAALKKSLAAIRPHAKGLKFLVTTHWRASLDGLIDIWCPNLAEWDTSGHPAPSVYDGLKKRGQELWLYPSCTSHGCSGSENLHVPDLAMDRPSAFHRALPWAAFRYGATGVLYYNTVESYGKGAGAPWKDPKIFDGYGEGTLFYPCTQEECGIDDLLVFPSLRLKILRDGLEDAEILYQAKKAGKPALAWSKEVVTNTRSFLDQTREYEARKVKALQALE